VRPPQLAASLRGCAVVLGGWPRKQRAFGCLSFRELLAISDHRLTNVRAPCASVRIFLSNQNVLASERSAARLAHQSGGLGVPGSNPGAPTNRIKNLAQIFNPQSSQKSALGRPWEVPGRTRCEFGNWRIRFNTSVSFSFAFRRGMRLCPTS
jgi:hypothetical protein